MSARSRAQTAKPRQVDQTPNVALVERTGQGLRDALFDEIDLLRSGNGDRLKALAVAALAGRLMAIVKVEIEYNRQVSQAAKAGGQALPLGTMKLGHG